MGFGYFFFGVLMLLSVAVPTSYEYNIGIDIFPDLAGYLLMLTAAKRLSSYAAGFRRMTYPLFFLCIAGLVLYAAGIISVFIPEYAVLEKVVMWSEALSYPLQMCALVFMFLGIYSLSLSVELPKIAARAKNGIFFTTVYFAVRIIMFVAGSVSSSFSGSVIASYVYYFLSIFWYLYIIFTAYVIFRCYMYICYEGEENVMPVNPAPRFLENILSKFGKGKKSQTSEHRSYHYDDDDDVSQDDRGI